MEVQLSARLRRTLGRPGFWAILLSLLIISLPHYREALQHPAFLTNFFSTFGLSRHAFERILYLAPIAWAAFLLGWWGAFLTSLVALALMLARIMFISTEPLDAAFETGAVFIIGNILAISFNALRKEREQRYHLAALNKISNVISQSLELKQILTSSIDTILEVIKADAALVFLLDDATDVLDLAAHKGVADELAAGVDRLRVGEGLNGMVAKTGKPLFVDDAGKDPRVTRPTVQQHGIRSEIIVPLICKDKVNGTLCIARYSHRWFQPEEVKLLIAIGNQVGLAVGNAHLYGQQHKVAEELKEMQENLRFYLRQVTRAQEEERKRIALELHDETIQALVVLSRQLDAITSRGDGLSENVRLGLEQLRQQTNNIMQGVRRLSQDLRPAALDRLGLLSALKWLASDVAQYSGIATRVTVVGQGRRLPEEAEVALFRITQEALRNIWRHSQATQVEIVLEFDQRATRITISDNGKGFRVPSEIRDLARKGKLGLAGMLERARLVGGVLTVQSQPGNGCKITVELPA